MLMFIIICLIYGKLIYIFKPTAYLTYNPFENEIIPFLPNIINEIENENKKENNMNNSSKGIEQFFTCFSKDCFIEIGIIFIN